MRSVSNKSVQRWRVTQIGGSRACEICELEGKDAPSAIKRAIRLYAIDDPFRQQRLIAYRVAVG